MFSSSEAYKTLIFFQNNDKDQKIASLQRQLDCKTLVSSPVRDNCHQFELLRRVQPAPPVAAVKKNGATQTERVMIYYSSTKSAKKNDA